MILSEKALTQHTYSRIISLVPSQTELLAYLGLETAVVGITKFCVHPSGWFHHKTMVGGTKNLDFQKIESLSPDLIIANKEENVKEQIEALAAKFDVWITDVNCLEDALTMIKDIGTLTGSNVPALKLALEIEEGFEKLKELSVDIRKITAAYFIWKEPWMVAAAGTFINDMMNYAGFRNAFADLHRYPPVSLSDVIENGTEMLLLSSEPYPFGEKHKKELQEMLPKLKVELVDGEMFSWYGSRLLKSIKYFRSLFKKF